MCMHKTKLVAFMLIPLFFGAFPLLGQEKESSQEVNTSSPISPEDFFEQYMAAFKEGDNRKMDQLIQENRENVNFLAPFLLIQAEEAIQEADYEAALTILMASRELFQRLDNALGRLGEAASLIAIGRIYHDTSEYQKALSYYQDTLKISKETDDKDLEIIPLSNIGSVYFAIGDYQRALKYLQEALQISREISNKAGEGMTLNNIGEIYRSIGDYRLALKYLQEALQISQEIGDKAGEGAKLNNIGMIYLYTGEYQQALKYLHEALQVSREFGDRALEGTVLNSFGNIYFYIGDYQRALKYFQEALQISREFGNKAGEGTRLNNIGMVYWNTGEYQQALSYYQKSLQISREIGDKAGEGDTLNNIGGVYLRTGEYQQALRYSQEALKLIRESGNEYRQGIACANIGYFYEQQGKWIKAIAWYKQAIALLEVIWSKAGGSETKENFLGQEIDVYLRSVKLLLQVNSPGEAFVYTERSKARSFLEQLYEASTGVKHGVDQQLLEEETTLHSKLFALEQHLKQPVHNEQRKQLLKERNLLEHELSVLQMRLRTSNPRYAELKYPQPVTVEQVQQEILKEGEVLVEYLQGEGEIYTFLLSKMGFFTHTLKISEKELVDTLIELLIPIHKDSHNEWNSSLAYQLYHLIFQPLEQEIAEASQGKEIKNLIIVPDGGLFYLPFEMLVTKDGETPEYLVDHYPITYAPSVSVLKPEILQNRQPEQYAQDLLALAPFGEAETVTAQITMKATENLLLSNTLRSGLEGIQPLPYSAGEVQTISRLYPQSVFKIGADATKAYFKDHAKGNRYLHLSTHGYLDNEHAMYSGLLFSDGMLQTYEIFNMDIDAELTVLSACQTGLGELKAGEGLVGLTRAFMYAGSPSVLVSLWSVSDPSTAAFMKRFYRNLNKGMMKAQALRETKIWMKEKSYHTDKHGNVIKHDDPFYWAPFILVGSGGHSLKETPPVMPTPIVPTVPQKLSQEDVLTLQKRLVELGYNPGPVDGIWGKKTEDALKKFQQDNGLPVTGKLDEETQKKLGW